VNPTTQFHLGIAEILQPKHSNSKVGQTLIVSFVTAQTSHSTLQESK